MLDKFLSLLPSVNDDPAVGHNSDFVVDLGNLPFVTVQQDKKFFDDENSGETYTGLLDKEVIRDELSNDYYDAILPKSSQLYVDEVYYEYGSEGDELPEVFYYDLLDFDIEWDENAIEDIDGEDFLPLEKGLNLVELDYERQDGTYGLDEYEYDGSFALANLSNSREPKLYNILSQGPIGEKVLLRIKNNVRRAELVLIDYDANLWTDNQVPDLDIFDMTLITDDDDIPGAWVDAAIFASEVFEGLTEPVTDAINNVLEPIGVEILAKGEVDGNVDGYISKTAMHIHFEEEPFAAINPFLSLNVMPFDLLGPNSDGLDLGEVDFKLKQKSGERFMEGLMRVNGVKEMIGEAIPSVFKSTSQ